MPKILDLAYAGELGAANYILGVRDGITVRFSVEVLQDDPIVNSLFTALTDTPSNYTDQAGKLLIVNPEETALKFTDAPISLPAGGTAGQVLTKNSIADGDASWAESLKLFTSLEDTPSSYSGKGGKIVKVNSGGTGLEFGDVTTGSGSADSSSASKIFTYTHVTGGL